MTDGPAKVVAYGDGVSQAWALEICEKIVCGQDYRPRLENVAEEINCTLSPIVEKAALADRMVEIIRGFDEGWDEMNEVLAAYDSLKEKP